MAKTILAFYLLGYSLCSWALPESPTGIENKEFGFDKVKNNITKIKTLKPENYLSSIDSFRKSIDRFVRYKRRVCNGEFSSLVLENGETVKGQKERLTEEEKIICFRELKSIQEEFIKNMFEARVKYLDHLHQKQVIDLKKAKEELLKSLDKTFRRVLFKAKRRGKRKRVTPL